MTMDMCGQKHITKRGCGLSMSVHSSECPPVFSILFHFDFVHLPFIAVFAFLSDNLYSTQTTTATTTTTTTPVLRPFVQDYLGELVPD